MKACLKRPCPEPTSIQNVGTNIIDELIETLEGNQHLAKQLKALKTNRHRVSEICSIVLDKIVRLEEEIREFKQMRMRSWKLLRKRDNQRIWSKR